MTAFECFVVATLLNLRATTDGHAFFALWWRSNPIIVITLDAAIFFAAGLAKLVLP